MWLVDISYKAYDSFPSKNGLHAKLVSWYQAKCLTKYIVKYWGGADSKIIAKKWKKILAQRCNIKS